MKKTSTKKIGVLEIVLYSIAAVVAFVGLVSLTFGIVGQHLTVALDVNWIKTAEANIVLDFRIWGIILVSTAAVMAVIVLMIFASRADRKYEKSLRRQQRLSASAVDNMEIRPAVETVEVDSKPVE